MWGAQGDGGYEGRGWGEGCEDGEGVEAVGIWGRWGYGAVGEWG